MPVAAVATLVLVAVLVAIRHAPRPPLVDSIGASQAVHDRHGRLLRLTLAPDQQYRLWTPLDAVSPVLVQALLLHEDRHYFLHPGVNPFALLRAAWATVGGGARQGGSTLSMQLARLYYGLDTRRIPGKLRQVAAALWLEARYAKLELLEAHLNLMPYGGNVQGVGTAARIYFDKPAARLSLPEALSLVLIPQSPRARAPAPGKTEPEALRAARQRLFERWVTAHPDDAHERGLVALPLNYRGIDDLPFEAPHLSRRLLAGTGARQIRGTVDLSLQRALQREVDRHLLRHASLGLRNAAAMLLDWRDMGVRALIGSADFLDADLHGQVDGTRARRSPGSTLKPFIYGLAIDQGLIHPRTVLKDAPTAFGPFSPENFDGAFVGPIDATQALVRSRNVPAVALASRLRGPGLHGLLRDAGVEGLASPEHYGLALVLGGGELTIEELLRLYAVLPNGGRLRGIRFSEEDELPADDGARLLSAEASYMLLDMLRANPRPDDLVIQGVAGGGPVAWKTGTSWGFRDAWTVGVFGPYVLAVWVGEFDGRSNPAFVGLHAAAPLFFRMVEALRAHPDFVEPARTQPPNLAHVEVCTASGDLPNAHCPQTTSTAFIPGTSPIRLSRLHRRVAVDRRSGRRACAPFEPAQVRWELHEYWPSDLMRLFALAGVARRPPPADDCGTEHPRGPAPQIVSPLDGVRYPVRDGHLGQTRLVLNAHAEGDVRHLYWFVDDAYVGTTAPGVALGWNPSRPGQFQVRVLDEHGRGDQRALRVELLP